MPKAAATAISPAALLAYRHGIASQKKHAFSEAIGHYDHAITLQNDFSAAVSRRAFCFIKLAEQAPVDQQVALYRQAIEGYKQAQNLPPSETSAFPGDDYDALLDHFDLGYAYEMIREFTEADAEYNAYLAKRPTEAGVKLRSANLLWKMGRLADAESAYRQALVDHPHFVEASNNLAQLLVVLNKPAAAEALIKAAINDPVPQWVVTDPPQPWGLYDTLATAYLAMATQYDNDDLLADAIASLDQARSGLALPPGTSPGADSAQDLATIELRRGYCYAKRGNLKNARQALTQALRLSAPYSEVQLAASRNMQLLPSDAAGLVQVPLDVVGDVVAVVAFLLLIFSCIELARAQLDSAAFATIVISSLGAALLGFSLPRLASFKLGGAEATLSQQVVLKTSFELTEIAAPTG